MEDVSKNVGNGRVRKKDRRSIYTESVIKDALLHEIADVSYANSSISSVCRRAEITRPTFYLHYDNLSSVLDELIGDVAKEIGDVPMELCDECAHTNIEDSHRAKTMNPEGKTPFCQVVLGKGKYAALFRDDYIAGLAVERIVDDFVEASLEAGVSQKSADRMRILNLFRMNGCMAAAKSFMRHGRDWSEAMPILDKFVASGFGAVLGDE